VQSVGTNDCEIALGQAITNIFKTGKSAEKLCKTEVRVVLLEVSKV
jgi:hypothetical protein